MNPIAQRCGKCGQAWLLTHFCPALHTPSNTGARPVQALTEIEIRRIVRDELQRAGLLLPTN